MIPRSMSTTAPGRRGLTLGMAFAIVLALAFAAGAAIAYRMMQAWRDSLLSAADELRESASQRADETVRATLADAQRVLEAVEAQVQAGIIQPSDPVSLEGGLLAPLLDHPLLTEIALTRDARSGPAAARQVSVFRDGGALHTRRTFAHGDHFWSERRWRPPGESALAAVPFVREADRVDDPAAHATFETLAMPVNRGRLIWSDLHYSELDSHLPEDRRRIVVTVLKALYGANGAPSVLRVAFSPAGLDAVGAIRVDPAAGPRDPHRVFLCDEQGRLVTRLSPEDRMVETDGDLRVVSDHAPPEVVAALHDPAVGASLAGPQTVRLVVNGRAYLARFEALAGTQDWRVGIVGPEAHYLGDLQQAREHLLVNSVLMGSALVLLGALALRGLRRALHRIVESTGRMSAFDFAASPPRSPFGDVREVLQGLELAKTALRAMSRYVPVDLVRDLYASRREPALGGELREISMMFTDIEGFTTFSERMGPDALAAALGRYLEVMTDAIHATGGIIDKYVGDAVMALWNAPAPCPDHPLRACRAALGCQEAERRLCASPEWAGRPTFRTRFGLHTDTVMVGHFGAPDRMSYTALGDGVNLSSRLEGLNKQYGTTVLVSESIRRAVGEACAFRIVDVVAVKGRTRGVPVYELLGLAGAVDADRLQAAAAYERAFQHYRERRFAEALSSLAVQEGDPVAAVLAERCRLLAAEPPDAEWDGVWHAREK